MRRENCDLCSTPFGDLLREAGLRSGVLVLQGGPGTGKTFFLEEMKRRARASGSLCLYATGFREERDVPFSVVEQFLHVPGIPESIRSAVRQLVKGAAPATPSGSATAHLLRDLVSTLVAAARNGGILVLVDDAQYTDPASQACLLYLARRAQSHDITFVVAYPHVLREGVRAHLEFVGIPGARLIEAAGLREQEVRELLENGLGAEAAARLAAPVHRISGGNPALATALVRDLLLAGTAAPEASVPVGDAFRTAYLACLVRHPNLAQTVQALAVLGDAATPARVAHLLECTIKEAGQHIAELERAGLLGDDGFRHPAVPGAVLGMLDAELPALHRRAAELLFTEGAPALAVARHLVAADEPPAPSRVRVLRHASQQLVRAGRADEALACLRLADRADLDEGERGKVTSALVDAVCRVNPLAAEPEVRRLLAAARAGRADCRALRLLVIWFLWFGCHDQAREVMALLVATCEPSHAHDGAQGFRALIGCLWPELLDDTAVRLYLCTARDVTAPARYGATATPPLPAASAGSARRRLPTPVTSVDGADNDAAGRRPPPGVMDSQRFWELDLATVLELMQKGETALAGRLCEEQWQRLSGQEPPARRAFQAGLRAHIRWNLGDLRTAAACAASALDQLPDHSWGVAVGMPLSVLIAAHTLMGDPGQAARYLERPVPDEMWDSSFGPLYRIARGCYLLETGRPRAALNEFLACPASGEALQANALGPLGRRAYAAEAYLALGEPERARRMAIAELMQDHRPVDARGRALLVLAAVDGPERRRHHLEEAERVLRAAGSRLSLARALAHLSQADLADGHTRTARARWREALSLATECGAPHLLRHLATPHDEPSPAAEPFPAEHGRPARAGVPPTVTVAVGGLTEAEWRVASLAASGRSNRQIATQLYITVSTVEQHLTRVYRKLSVRRRSDLADLLGLQPQAGEPGRSAPHPARPEHGSAPGVPAPPTGTQPSREDDRRARGTRRTRTAHTTASRAGT
ncbi:LuxR C-terminal-related transcriptional regulator [Streptomyces sp. NPDC047841]|uniref:helix-turn-helix transcriptional regulator n=1 Tax=Streptomyces sp. NPDC047841 TaxID=3154708 RepID=UPI003454FAE3